MCTVLSDQIFSFSETITYETNKESKNNLLFWFFSFIACFYTDKLHIDRSRMIEKLSRL